MDRTSAGLLAGWALILAAPALALANLFRQWRSCRLDWQIEHAPVDAGSWSDLRRPLSLACDTVYGLSDGSTVVVPAPYDWSFVLASAFLAGIALVVVCIVARRTPASTVDAT